jgi:hypothetical protein
MLGAIRVSVHHILKLFTPRQLDPTEFCFICHISTAEIFRDIKRLVEYVFCINIGIDAQNL